ncbi:MAG: AraC family transcriptional regulator [Pseudomonadota bacterium]|nr:AraC family transcriptional regulator [Pseudomonadota bacterium]
MPDIHLPLSGSVFLETSDAELARREMSKILAPHAMTPADNSHSFLARHHHARLGGMSVNFIQYSPGASISADLSRRFYLIHHVLGGECRLGSEIGGRVLTAGDIAVINPTEPFSLKTTADCGQIVIKLESTVLNDAAHKRFSIPADPPIRFDAAIQSAQGASVARIINLICKEADTSRSDGVGPKTEVLLAELFVVTLIESLPHNHSAIIASKGSESGIAPWYVKRVEEFLELHAGRDIRIRDMTAIAGVSERTLYNGFRVWRATSPKSYLKAVRLDRVRTELLGLKAKSRSVSEIAREAGFRHMGNFARDYGKRFGERPSDTLRYRITTNE